MRLTFSRGPSPAGEYTLRFLVLDGNRNSARPRASVCSVADA